MYRQRTQLFSGPVLFVLLMAASVASMIWPNNPFGFLRTFTQILAIPQMGVAAANHFVAGRVQALHSKPVPPDEHAELVRQKQALENVNAAQAQRIHQLQATVEQLTRIRGRGFPSDGLLIPARVIAQDATPGRDSLLVGKGRAQNVQPGDWVTSSLLVDAGSEDGVRDQTAVLSREYLVGWVESTTPLTSRIVLLTDRLASHPIRVNLARRGEAAAVLSPEGKPISFVLEGAGSGWMRIPDIPADLVESGRVRVGDQVLTDAHNPWLPMTMMVGTIESLERPRDQQKPLFFDARVRNPCEPATLSQVFVVDLTQTALAAPPADKPAKPATTGASKKKR